MGETPRRPDGTPETGRVDQEIDGGRIWGFVAILGLIILVVHVVIWGMVLGYGRGAARRDPAPSPLAEANERRLPPAPRLQAAPALDMTRLRAREETVLKSYGWVDRSSGIGRIPLDRAVELLLERGLPVAAGPAPGAAPSAAPGPADGPRRDAGARGVSRHPKRGPS